MHRASAIPLAPRRLCLALALTLAVTLTPALTARADGITYVVQSGETLFRIGLRYGVSWRDLMAANGLQSTTIHPGQVLIIPSGASVTGIPGAANTGGAATPSAPTAAATPAPAAAPSSVYIVQRGDTLNLVAQRYHLSVAELMQANRLANPNLIYAGQALSLPSATGHWLAVTGHPQALPLDCESRSAADWAGYFGVTIDELEFFNRLPLSDDPDAGFVGDVLGAWGQTPPNAYGVHAGPIASLLRAYGVNARAASGLDWDTLQAEIDHDRPVIVWVVGHAAYGVGFPSTAASDGHTTLVARYEHTLLVTGYGRDTVTLLDGAMSYTRPLAQFLASWGALDSQAVLAQ